MFRCPHISWPCNFSNPRSFVLIWQVRKYNHSSARVHIMHLRYGHLCDWIVAWNNSSAIWNSIYDIIYYSYVEWLFIYRTITIITTCNDMFLFMIKPLKQIFLAKFKFVCSLKKQSLVKMIKVVYKQWCTSNKTLKDFCGNICNCSKGLLPAKRTEFIFR